MTEPGTCPVPITLHLLDKTWFGQVKPHGLRSCPVVALMVPIIGEKDPGGWHGACPHSPCVFGTPDLPSDCTRSQAPPPGPFLEASWAALPCSGALELQGLASVQLGSSLPQERPSSSHLHLSHRSQIPRSPLLRYSSCSSGFLLHLFLVVREAFLNSSLLTFLGLGPLTMRPFHLGPKTSGNPPKCKSTPSI